jgi:hypothetical protein
MSRPQTTSMPQPTRTTILQHLIGAKGRKVKRANLCPDLHLTIEDTVSEGENVVVR